MSQGKAHPPHREPKMRRTEQQHSDRTDGGGRCSPTTPRNAREKNKLVRFSARICTGINKPRKSLHQKEATPKPTHPLTRSHFPLPPQIYIRVKRLDPSGAAHVSIRAPRHQKGTKHTHTQKKSPQTTYGRTHGKAQDVRPIHPTQTNRCSLLPIVQGDI